MAAVTETAQIAARVPVDLIERAEAIAKADDRTLSYVVRLALKTYVATIEEAEAGTAA